MKTTKVLQTNISETNILEVSNILNTSTKNRVAICNANTLVRSVRNVGIRNSINNFTIKAPDGFPVAKALSFLTKQKFSRVDGYKVFLQTIEDGLSLSLIHISEPTRRRGISYAVFCLKKKKQKAHLPEVF